MNILIRPVGFFLVLLVCSGIFGTSLPDNHDSKPHIKVGDVLAALRETNRFHYKASDDVELEIWAEQIENNRLIRPIIIKLFRRNKVLIQMNGLSGKIISSTAGELKAFVLYDCFFFQNDNQTVGNASFQEYESDWLFSPS